jgi:hypothetical protein
VVVPSLNASFLPLQLGEVIDLPEYQDCEWHTSAHVIIQLRMVQGVPAYTCWSREWHLGRAVWAEKASAVLIQLFYAPSSSPARSAGSDQGASTGHCPP